jgi:hypothetical protein
MKVKCDKIDKLPNFFEFLQGKCVFQSWKKNERRKNVVETHEKNNKTF